MWLKKSNENLAWLGDALIYWTISQTLYDPDQSNQRLTEKRKPFIEEQSLAKHAKELGLDEAIYITEGEEKQGGRKNPKNLHTVYEALIGAIYLDQGYEQTKGFIQKIALLEK